MFCKIIAPILVLVVTMFFYSMTWVFDGIDVANMRQLCCASMGILTLYGVITFGILLAQK